MLWRRRPWRKSRHLFRTCETTRTSRQNPDRIATQTIAASGSTLRRGFCDSVAGCRSGGGEIAPIGAVPGKVRSRGPNRQIIHPRRCNSSEGVLSEAPVFRFGGDQTAVFRRPCCRVQEPSGNHGAAATADSSPWGSVPWRGRIVVSFELLRNSRLTPGNLWPGSVISALFR